MASTENLIEEHIMSSKEGSIFYPADFEDYGSIEAVNVALHRLAKLKLIKRLSFGIYAKPTVSKLIGDVYPSAEQVAQAIARRDKARLLHTGAFAQNMLGLSTQVPTKVVYLTDGPARKIKLANTTILFKKASPKLLALKGDISKLVVMALKDIGKDNLTPDEEKKILTILKKENPELLKHDIRLAPRWIGEIMAKAL
jgi:hypothetical protein